MLIILATSIRNSIFRSDFITTSSINIKWFVMCYIDYILDEIMRFVYFDPSSYLQILQ